MYEVEIRYEERRGCGYRRAGKDGVGIYLVGARLGEVCERLPYPLTVCPTCNEGIKFSRGFKWIDCRLFSGGPLCSNNGNHRHQICPLCTPEDKAGLMWVGDKYYTPQSFIVEAEKMGVSKRMNAVPRDFRVGEDWIYLAHNKVPLILRALDTNISPGDNPYFSSLRPAVFCAFLPSAVELVIDDPEKIPEKAKALADKLGGKAKIVKVEKIEEKQEALDA